MTETTRPGSRVIPRRSSASRVRSGWPAVTGLLLLSALPILGGVLRLEELGTDPASAPSSPFLTVAIVAHIVGMSLYCLLGAFQFSPALRERREDIPMLTRHFLGQSAKQLGVEPMGTTPEQMTSIIRSEQPVYAEAVRAAGLGR